MTENGHRRTENAQFLANRHLSTNPVRGEN
jgi:hypothetical protein